jgi:hypothetical protein
MFFYSHIFSRFTTPANPAAPTWQTPAAEALVIPAKAGIVQILDAFLGSEKAKKTG